MRKSIVLISMFLASAIIYYSLPQKAEAIPYFARKYDTQCAMCHIQFPRLNSAGMTFKQNGYRLTGEEGDYIWQAKFFPLSGRAAFRYKMLDREGRGWEGKDGAQSIFLLDEMELFSAGTLAPRISYFLDLGSEEEKGFAPGIAFIIFDDILSDSRMNLKAGKFYNEFLYLANKRRLTLEPYMSPVTRVQYGVELNGEIQPQGFIYALGVANDEMTTGTDVYNDNEITAPGQTPANFKFANNYVRAFYGWLTYGTNGHTIGVRGYTSRAGIDSRFDEDHTQLDANLNLQFGPAVFTLGYYAQSNVEGVNDSPQVNLLTELILLAGPRLLVDLRYEHQDKDKSNAEDTKYVLSTAYYINPNISLITEHSSQNGKESQYDENKFQIGIQLSF